MVPRGCNWDPVCLYSYYQKVSNYSLIHLFTYWSRWNEISWEIRRSNPHITYIIPFISNITLRLHTPHYAPSPYIGTTITGTTAAAKAMTRQAYLYNTTLSSTNTTKWMICSGCDHTFAFDGNTNWVANQLHNYFRWVVTAAVRMVVFFGQQLWLTGLIRLGRLDACVRDHE